MDKDMDKNMAKSILEAEKEYAKTEDRSYLKTIEELNEECRLENEKRKLHGTDKKAEKIRKKANRLAVKSMKYIQPCFRKKP